MRHAHQPIVDDDGEVVGGMAVGSQQHLVADDVCVKADVAPHEIGERNLAVLRRAEADGRPLAGLHAPLRFCGIDLRAPARVFRRQIVRERLFALGVELLGRAEAVVRAPFLDEHARARLIFPEPLGRSVRPHRSADLRPLIPVQAEPAQILEDHRVGVGRRALDVGVFDAKDERAVLPARQQPVEERCADVADVQVPGRARSESDAHGL